jgi:hypothetical protein
MLRNASFPGPDAGPVSAMKEVARWSDGVILFKRRNDAKDKLTATLEPR